MRLGRCARHGTDPAGIGSRVLCGGRGNANVRRRWCSKGSQGNGQWFVPPSSRRKEGEGRWRLQSVKPQFQPLFAVFLVLHPTAVAGGSR